jgi:SRSO17 transposase
MLSAMICAITSSMPSVVGETGDIKKGIHSVGVQRQYSGAAGRIDAVPVEH